MESRTARFDRAVTYGATSYSEIDVVRAGTIIATDVPILGTPVVNVDSGAAIRRTLSLDVPDADGALLPTIGTDVLAPYGSELVVRSGFRYVDGTTETVPLGVFRINEAETRVGRIKLSGQDRASVVANARFEAPYVIPAGTSLATNVGGVAGGAIRDLIDSRYPGLTYQWMTSTRTVPLTVFEEGDKAGDPWRNAQQLAAADGLEVFFDAVGAVVLRPVPNPEVDPVVWTYEPGPTSILLSTVNRLVAAGARNVAVVRGEGTGVAVPVRAVAEVTDVTSPLHPSSFGRRPVFLVSSLITTQAQANAAAAALLLREAGGSELLSFEAVPHPGHDAGDVVQVVSPVLAGGSAYVVLGSFGMPVNLRAPVAFSTKARRAA